MKTLPIILFLVLSTFHILAQIHSSTVELDKQTSLTALIETFEPSKHSYDTCGTGLGWKAICLIDKQLWFGSDDGMELPKNQLVKLSLQLKDYQIELDVKGLYNASWDNQLRKEQFKLEKAEIGYILTGYFSDGAGAYSVQWLIVNGTSMRTLITLVH